MLAALAGVVVGYSLGADSRGELRAREATPPAAPVGPVEPSNTLLEELAQELRELRASSGLLIPPAPLAAVPSAQPGPSSPAREAPASSRNPIRSQSQEPAPIHPELRRWMQRIEDKLAVAASGSSVGQPLRLPPAGFPAAAPPLPAPDDEDQEAFARSHFLWGLQDVLDVYGVPAIVHPDGNELEWEYKYAGGGDLGDMHFVFHNGLCVSAYAH